LAEVVDPYLDPDTGLLRNLVGARTQGALDQAEGDLTYIRAAELQERPVRPTGDLDEFRAIHRQLFQDVYPWAGEVRTVDLRKNVAGAEHFLSVGAIDRGSMFAADELRADNMLRGMKREQFIDRLSHHYDQWNTGGSALLGCELYAYDLPPLDRARNGDRGVRPRRDHRIRGASAKASSSIERSP
jgi:cell filamentation protein